MNVSTGVDSAVEGPLSATGQYSREHGGLHEELPLAFWETSGLDAIVQLDESAECKTEPKAILPDILCYVDLRADTRQVKRNWPSPLLTRLTPRFLHSEKRAS